MMTIDDDILTWIKLHANDDVGRLMLKYGSDPVLKFAIVQIDCRKRTAKKLSETLKCDRFIFPTVLSSEQATSDALAKFHATLIPTGGSVIDLTCGLGIDTFAFAHIASHVTSIELNKDIATAAQLNANSLGLDNVTVINSDCSEFITDPQLHSDIIFIDPARRGSGGKRLFALSDCSPDVPSLLKRMLDIAPTVIIKASPMLDITHTIRELHNVTRIIVTGTTRECKELIIICNRGTALSLPAIEAVTIHNGSVIDSFDFNLLSETSALPLKISMPTAGNILYEPHPAIMKTAPYKQLSMKFNVAACDVSSHLYLSTDTVDNFPGKAYRIEAVYPFNKQGIRQLTSSYKAFDITVRNFPITPPELAKKLKSTSSANARLFATTALNKRIMIYATPIPLQNDT